MLGLKLIHVVKGPPENILSLIRFDDIIRPTIHQLWYKIAHKNLFTVPYVMAGAIWTSYIPEKAKD